MAGVGVLVGCKPLIPDLTPFLGDLTVLTDTPEHPHPVFLGTHNLWFGLYRLPGFVVHG